MVTCFGMVDDELTIAECSSKATLTNVAMNVFTESKKLKFGIDKWNKIHIGSSTLVCDEIKVHEEIGKKVDKDKNVGDMLTNDGSNTEKVKERTNQGCGIIVSLSKSVIVKVNINNLPYPVFNLAN